MIEWFFALGVQMNGQAITYYNNYSPVGDVLVLATSIVFFILVRSAYINRSQNFAIFRRMMMLLPMGAICDMVFYILLNSIGHVSVPLIYATRMGYHACIFGIMVLYIYYLIETVGADPERAQWFKMLAWIGYGALLLYEFLGAAFGFGFYIVGDQVHSGFPVFALGYLYFMVLLITALLKIKTRVYRHVILGVSASSGVSVLVMFIQGIYGQRSFTTATFLFPLFALLYLVHANPYDLTIGAVAADSFEDFLEYNHQRGKNLFLMSLYLPAFTIPGEKYPKEIQQIIRDYSSKYFKDALLFRIGDGHLVLVIELEKNPDYELGANRMVEAFYANYDNYNYEYKIIFTESDEQVYKKGDYINLIQYIQNRIPVNTFHRANAKDIQSYLEHIYIVSELADIAAKRDMDDPRVLVFCQPVYNTGSEIYDTAEALMRLRLPDMGMVFPDRFIPIAEKYNYIQVLSMIILAKVCHKTRELLDEGYHFTRISVNFSPIDLREKDFADNVKNAIYSVGIPADLIAIEITESQNESDFKMAKAKIDQLQQSGIKFYLDDFGTGYSNFERIMELPFDIIKFDRSLTIASSKDAKSETMVSYLAHMFSDMGYAVLYEGIEDDSDENRCMNMCARYLQGYKYSKPIPIEQLAEFFIKEDEYAERFQNAMDIGGVVIAG